MRNILFISINIFAVIFILVLFFMFQLLGGQKQSPENQSALPTTVPLSISRAPAVKYDAKKSVEFANLAKNRQTLSTAGQTAKQTLIDSLKGEPGTLYSSESVVITYIPSLDLFQGEILMPNISQAKLDAVNWLTSQGLAQADTCKLPLSFYLSPDMASQQQTGANFNPLPEGC